MRKQWRCYHCDQVFRNELEAGIHFGADQAGTCACVLPHEQHLVEHIRDLETQLASYRSESDCVMRSIQTLEAEHRQALIRAEQDGYDKGLKDGQGEPPVPIDEARIAAGIAAFFR
jgi:Arc/MetJ-type ribon-helix-helix transcriptional regulator